MATRSRMQPRSRRKRSESQQDSQGAHSESVPRAFELNSSRLPSELELRPCAFTAAHALEQCLVQQTRMQFMSHVSAPAAMETRGCIPSDFFPGVCSAVVCPANSNVPNLLMLSRGLSSELECAESAHAQPWFDQQTRIETMCTVDVPAKSSRLASCGL